MTTAPAAACSPRQPPPAAACVPRSSPPAPPLSQIHIQPNPSIDVVYGQMQNTVYWSGEILIFGNGTVNPKYSYLPNLLAYLKQQAAAVSVSAGGR